MDFFFKIGIPIATLWHICHIFHSCGVSIGTEKSLLLEFQKRYHFQIFITLLVFIYYRLKYVLHIERWNTPKSLGNTTSNFKYCSCSTLLRSINVSRTICFQTDVGLLALCQIDRQAGLPPSATRRAAKEESGIDSNRLVRLCVSSRLQS